MLQGVDFHWFPLDNPGLVSIPLSFLLGVVGTLIGERRGDTGRRYAGRHPNGRWSGKSGVNPARSRHCDWATTSRMKPLGRQRRPGKARLRGRSQETYLRPVQIDPRG